MITLKNLEQASAKEVLEQAKAHLLAQNAQSILSTGICAYRGNGGLKCAAGCFIGDDEYETKMEKRSWSMLVSKGYVPSSHSHMINNIQEIHDNYPPFEWRELLIKVAIEHGIEQ